MENFEGTSYRLATNWHGIIDVNDYKDRPIKYLEIGAYYGANLISVAETFALHPDSVLYCIDPWISYPDYDEYKDELDDVYRAFFHNLQQSGYGNKVVVKRGFSHLEIPKFHDNKFDIIYIDGNHDPQYVLEDAVLSFRKLKVGGVMIFDDYGWGGVDIYKRAVDGFIMCYYKKIALLGEKNTQFFIKKTS